LVAVKVTLEVLEQDHLLVDGIREIVEVVLAYHLLVFCGSLRSSLTINVVEMEKVWVCDDLSGVIEQHTVGAIAQLVAKTVF